MKVFLDTNILKFSSVKHHVRKGEKTTINWGGIEHETEVFHPYTLNSLDRIKSDVLRRDATALPMLAKAGIEEKIQFFISTETQHETMGLPWIASASGRFFNCPIRSLPSPITETRVLYGGHRSADEWTDLYLEGLKDPRYLEICKVTGGYQGENSPLNRNQARDAIHLWTAETAEADSFVTMDYKLIKMVANDKKNRVRIPLETPSQFLERFTSSMGLFRGLAFTFRAYNFARKQVVFQETEGWV